MVVKEEKPITMAEVSALVGEGDRADAIKKFIKQFSKISPEKAKEMRSDLAGLNILKLKESHIVKIVDFMPREQSELNKVILDASLDAEESSKVLDVVKKY